MKVDGTPVVTSADNIMAENGVIHAISRVLMPNWIDTDISNLPGIQHVYMCILTHLYSWLEI